MELPKNGGIVIIDDKINEAIPLMNAFGKRGIAYTYYDGKRKNYPDQPLDCVRFIFLDMHLDEAAGVVNGNKNVIGPLMSGLSKIVGEENGPYVIMVWSKHDSQHMEDLRNAAFDGDELKSKPIAILNMEKAECFDIVYAEETSVEGNDVEWKLRDGGLEIIEQTLEDQINSVDAFELLYNWENGIRESARDTIKSIGELFDKDNEAWNDNLKTCFVRIAKAYAGEMLGETNIDIIRNVYYSLNDIICDRNCVLTEIISNKSMHEYGFLQKINGINGCAELIQVIDGRTYILSLDSGMYRLYKDKKKISEGKNIRKIFEDQKPEDSLVRKSLGDIYWNSIGSINALLHLRHYILDKIRPGNVYRGTNEMKNEICNAHNISEELRDDIIGIELEVSPICDYAQNKRMRIRILPGIMALDNVIDINNEKSKYTYITAPICIEGQARRLLFDFRYFTSEKEEYLRGKNALYAIGDGLLQNIKENLSTHGSRGGIVVME